MVHFGSRLYAVTGALEFSLDPGCFSYVSRVGALFAMHVEASIRYGIVEDVSSKFV
jgi:hypothetical protein